MSFKIFQRPKSHGGFELVSIKAKTLALKWCLFDRYRHTNTPFSSLLYTLLKLSKRKGFSFRDAKKIPASSSSFARDIIQTVILLKPTFQANNLLEVFSDSTISLPNLPHLPNYTSLTKKISLFILNAQHSFTLLREEQKKLSSFLDAKYGTTINWDTVWRKLRSLKGLRPAVRSFLYRLFNAGLYLPASCPLCCHDIHSGTLHFLQCSVINSTIFTLSGGLSISHFFEDPAKTIKKCPS